MLRDIDVARRLRRFRTNPSSFVRRFAAFSSSRKTALRTVDPLEILSFVDATIRFQSKNRRPTFVVKQISQQRPDPTLHLQQATFTEEQFKPNGIVPKPSGVC